MFIRIVAALSLLLLVISCNQKKKYCILTSNQLEQLNGSDTIITSVKDIYAESDSAAFWKGVSWYKNLVGVYEFESEIGSGHLMTPISFKVYNDKEKDLSQNLSAGELKKANEFLAENSKKNTLNKADSLIILEQSKIAYGALRFGMTEQEIDILPEKERELSQYLGNDHYNFNCRYDINKQLYLLEVEGVPKYADLLETNVKHQIDNLIGVISQRYGMPKYLNSYPLLRDYHAGSIIWVREWTVGDKIIKVGASEESGGLKYKAVCWIYDKPMYDAYLSKV